METGEKGLIDNHDSDHHNHHYEDDDGKKLIKMIKMTAKMMMTTKGSCAVNTCGCRMCRKPPHS